MKTKLAQSLIMIAVLAVSVLSSAQSVLIAAAQGSEGTEKEQIALKIASRYHCNQPQVSLKYLFSNKALFGPHHYKLVVTPTNKMRCLTTRMFQAKATLEETHRAGDHIVIYDDRAVPTKLILRDLTFRD